MIYEKMLNKVQYPDETGIKLDGEPYDRLIEKLRSGIEGNDEPLKADFQETLAELEKRWARRQVITTIKLYRENTPLNIIADKINESIEVVQSFLQQSGLIEAS